MRDRRKRESRGLRSWPVWTSPRRFLVVLGVVDALALLALVATFGSAPLTAHSSLVAAFLATIAIAAEEVMTRAARMRIRLSSEAHQDMQAVWQVAAALALPHAPAAILVILLLAYSWFRQQRPIGQLLHRELFNGANAVLSCLCAAAVFQLLSGSLDSSSWAVSSSVSAAAAIAAYCVVNRVVAACALSSLGLPARVTLGTRDENLIELATLSLGGLLALSLAHAPLLAILVLAPMVTLQRGAVMRQLETAATTDAKTGLMNAVAWEEIAGRELARAAGRGESVAVLIIDIDHFKRVNDRHGHLMGDRVLRRLARTLAAEVREYDTVARFGGEEFVAVLPSASASEALTIAERLRSRVNELRLSGILADIEPALDDRLAVSIGVATAPMDGVELPDLLHAADGALYRAKELGRNRVELADPGHGRELQTLPFA